jgi:predicted alpha/beta hydrolase
MRTPMLALSFTDDELMSKRSIDSLHGFYAGASKAMKHIAPAERGLARIGHSGFFRPQHQPSLWTEIDHWLARSPLFEGACGIVGSQAPS